MDKKCSGLPEQKSKAFCKGYSGKKAKVFMAVAMILTSIFLMQTANTFVRGMTGVLGPATIAALRLGIAALLAVLIIRPWRKRVEKKSILLLLCYGTALAFQILFTYYALNMVPVGIAVAVQFAGPLSVSLWYSRSMKELMWIILAVFGLYLILPLDHEVSNVSLEGVGIALLSGFFWGAYLVFGKKVTCGVDPIQGAALGMCIGTCILLPPALCESGTALFSWEFFNYGIFLAVFTSLIPYSLELIAIEKIPSALAGVLQSLHPVVGALFSAAVLGEVLAPIQWTAVVCIVIAAAGSSLSEISKQNGAEDEA